MVEVGAAIDAVLRGAKLLATIKREFCLMSIPRPVELATSLLTQLVDLESMGTDTYVGQPVPELTPHPRMYGGSMMAMMTRAAGFTVLGDQVPHMLHSLFLSAADAYQPVVIRVERTFDGGSFAARRVTLEQNAKTICAASISFTRPADGAVVGLPIRPGVPTPDSGFARRPVMEGAASTRPFDFLEFDVDAFATGSPHDTSRMIWVRLLEPIDDPAVLACVLAYLSDFGATIAARALVGATVSTPGRFATLNHSVWWHGPIRADSWILIDFRPIQAASSRGLVTATIHGVDGTHIATVAQEALMRISNVSDDVLEPAPLS